MMACPPATISSACVSFEVSPPSFPSVQLWSPRHSRFFICHICHVVSILHATLHKQTICPIMPSLRALFFPTSHPTICHLLLNLSQPFSHLVIPSRLLSASVPVTPNRPAARRLPLNCHTWKDSSSLLCLFWLCCSVSLMDMPLEVRVRSVENIKSEAKPDRICLSSESPPSPLLGAALVHLTLSLATIWLCLQELPYGGRAAIIFRCVSVWPILLKLLPQPQLQTKHVPSTFTVLQSAWATFLSVYILQH